MVAAGRGGAGRSAGAVGRMILRETVLVCAGVFVYFGVRGLTEGGVGTAHRNAARLVRLEAGLGLSWERPLQEVAAASDLAVTLANWVYIWGHWPLIVATLCWLALRHPRSYLRTRNAMLLSGAVGLVIFGAFPVSPPRLFDAGLVDTVTEFSRSYRVLQPPAFVNQYAAMPSLHVGWDALIGIAIAGQARRRWVRVLGALLPVAMTAAVILTANHYVLDVVAGLALTFACYALVVRRQARVRRPGRVSLPPPRTSPERPPAGVDRRGPASRPGRAA